MPSTDQHSYFHRGGETPLIGQTIYGYLEGVMAAFAEQEALIALPQDARLTYAQLDTSVAELSRGLLALGIERGERVGIWSTNNVEWVLLQLATARIGVVLVNINPAYRAAELEHALQLARVQDLFLIPWFKSSDYVAMLQSLDRAGLPDLRRVVIYDPANPNCEPPASSDFLTWQQLLTTRSSPDELVAREATLDPDDPINIQFTSGTTGFPKAVVLSHHNLINNAFIDSEGYGVGDKLCVPVPFYHCFGMVVSNLSMFTKGAAIVIPAEHFDPAATLKALSAERCTAMHGVPTMFAAVLGQPDFAQHDLTAMRGGTMAGAPCPPELLRRVMKDLHMPEVVVGYGQTETSPATHFTRPTDSMERRLETVGTNVAHIEAKVIDTETGAMVPLGAQGEVCIRGHPVMLGYFEDDEATRRAIDPAGWLHTGDLGSMDADGYLKITGRLKDMIIRGGENVYPAEVEAFYFEHPKVAQVAVFGIPDERLGEEVAAFINLHEGMTATADELRAYATDRIAHFKVPQYIWIVDDFPMTVTGKIQKFRMTEIAREWLTESGEPAKGDQP